MSNLTSTFCSSDLDVAFQANVGRAFRRVKKTPSGILEIFIDSNPRCGDFLAEDFQPAIWRS